MLLFDTYIVSVWNLILSLFDIYCVSVCYLQYYCFSIQLFTIYIFTLSDSLLRCDACSVLMADLVNVASIWRVLPQADWTIQAWENNRWDFTM